MTQEDNLEQKKKVALLALHLETRRKNLDWFDYQVRGNRWSDKSPDELKSERQEILDDIKRLEDELSSATKELDS